MNLKCIVNGVEQELPLAGYQRIQMPGLAEVVVPVPAYSGHYWLEYNADMTIPIITDIPPNAAGEVRRNAVTSTGLLADESKGAK